MQGLDNDVKGPCHFERDRPSFRAQGVHNRFSGKIHRLVATAG